MKRTVFLLIVAVITASSFILYYNHQSNAKYNALALANIEALSNGEDDNCVGEMCSIASHTANCYWSDNRWCCVRIVAVREYQRSSCVEICHHDRITQCPAGTYQGL